MFKSSAAIKSGLHDKYQSKITAAQSVDVYNMCFVYVCALVCTGVCMLGNIFVLCANRS